MKLVWSAVVLAVWGVTTIYGQRGCNPDGDVQVYDTGSFDTLANNAGRVEICMGGVWGTIAADSITTPWSEKNAQVACIQAGYSGVLNVVLQQTIPFAERSESSVVPIHLSGVRCNGSELDIVDCSRSSSVPSSVNHFQDAYVVCRPQIRSYSDVHPSGPQSGDIRLFGDQRNGYGAVEIFSRVLGWQGICPDSSWTNSDAATICQDLGYSSGTVTDPVGAIRTSTNGAPLDRLISANCPSRASDPLPRGVCSFQSSSGCSAPPNQFAALKCSNVSERSVRLLGGDDSQEGIVEIAYNGRWGMLCDNLFSSTDARSVCEGLGFGRDDASTMSLSSLSPILASESNLKPIWLTELACDSSDSSLMACIGEENIIGFANCRSFDIAAVDCGDPPGQISSGQIIGIVIGILAGLFVVGIVGYIYGKPYWGRRHSYDWYNTITTPSSWCDCDCDCFSSGTTTRQTTSWQSNTTSASSSTGITTGYVRSGSDNATATFNLARRPSLERQSQPEPEPEPVPEPSDPGLSKAPPPSYHTASNFPTHDPSADLPPPYPGPTALPGAAYPPPTAPGYPQTASAADTGYPPSWTSPAYPPPTAPSVPSELPYPSGNAPYPS